MKPPTPGSGPRKVPSAAVKLRVQEITKSALESHTLKTFNRIKDFIKDDKLQSILPNLSLDDGESHRYYSRLLSKYKFKGNMDNSIRVGLPEIPVFLLNRIMKYSGSGIFSLIMLTEAQILERTKASVNLKGDEPYLFLNAIIDTITTQVFNRPKHPFFNIKNGEDIAQHLTEYYEDNKNKGLQSNGIVKELKRYCQNVLGKRYAISIRNRLMSK